MLEQINLDFVNDFSRFNALKSYESFPVNSIEKDLLKNYKATEYVFNGMFSKRSEEKFKLLIQQFKQEVFDVLAKNEMFNYIFVIEHGSSVISYLRSYKGLIDKKKINSVDYFQKEYQLIETQSRIAFIAKINEDNFDYLSDFLFDSTNSFIISSFNDYLNEKSLTKITNLLNMNGWNHINLLNVMIPFCASGDYLYRIGGDDGEEYWSLQELKRKISN